MPICDKQLGPNEPVFFFAHLYKLPRALVQNCLVFQQPTTTHLKMVNTIDKELLREYYFRDAADGRITEHEVKKAVQHAGGGVCFLSFFLLHLFFSSLLFNCTNLYLQHISDHHAGHLLRSLAGWDGCVTEHEFVHGIHRYVVEHGHNW
jgi:hypothetical protein